MFYGREFPPARKHASTQARKFIVSTFIAFSVATPAIAGNAVSETNFKLQAVGGNIDNGNAKALMGSLTAPLGQNFGVQLDALTGELDSNSMRGYGLHGFGRDSDKGLLGIVASDVKSNGNKLKRTGIEGEYYFPAVTVAGELGKQRGDVPNASYGSLDLTWYPQENLAVMVGGSRADSVKHQHIGMEYQTKIKGLSVFADAAQGNSNYDHIMGGLTYYFGKQKTLKLRHREDDPRNPLLNAVQDVDTYFTQNPKSQNPKLVQCPLYTTDPITNEQVFIGYVEKESCDSESTNGPGGGGAG